MNIKEAKHIHFIGIGIGGIGMSALARILEGTGTDKLLPLLPDAQVHKTFASAVLSAIGSANKGDTILFSPLFSSFGKEFVNEYDRNDKFKKIIKEYYEK